jgi:hypothetical protein
VKYLAILYFLCLFAWGWPFFICSVLFAIICDVTKWQLTKWGDRSEEDQALRRVSHALTYIFFIVMFGHWGSTRSFIELVENYNDHQAWLEFLAAIAAIGAYRFYLGMCDLWWTPASPKMILRAVIKIIVGFAGLHYIKRIPEPQIADIFWMSIPFGIAFLIMFLNSCAIWCISTGMVRLFFASGVLGLTLRRAVSRFKRRLAGESAHGKSEFGKLSNEQDDEEWSALISLWKKINE